MHIVILGAGYAGLTAALRMARRSGGRVGVTLVNGSERFVERIRLHEIAAGRPARERSIQELLRGSGVTLLVGRATAVDRTARTVRVGDAVLPYDRLVLALGSRVDRSTPGAREHARSLDAADALVCARELPALAARRGRMVVVGGGLTGIEAATELAEAWPQLHVTLLTRGVVGAELSSAARAHFARVFARLGIEVIERTTVLRVEAGRLVTVSDAAPGEAAVPFDRCVWSPGMVGAALPDGLSLPTDARGRILVHPSLQSIADPHVLVAGDLAAPEAPIPIPMGCKSALPAGAHVADNVLAELAGLPMQPFDFVAPIYCISLGRRDGLIQRTKPDGSLHGGILRGRMAAWFKELVCSSTLVGFRMERIGLTSYAIFKGGNVATPQLEGGVRGALG